MKKIILLLLIPIYSVGSSITNSFSELPEIEKYTISDIEKKIPKEYYNLIKESCNEYNIPFIRFVRMLYWESKFDPNAINYNYKNGKLVSIDEGVCQQNSKYHSDFVWFDNDGKEFDPKNPFEAIPVSAHYLYRMYKEVGDWEIVFAGYNCGLTRAKTMNWPSKTIEYINYIFEK